MASKKSLNLLDTESPVLGNCLSKNKKETRKLFMTNKKSLNLFDTRVTFVNELFTEKPKENRTRNLFMTSKKLLNLLDIVSPLSGSYLSKNQKKKIRKSFMTSEKPLNLPTKLAQLSLKLKPQILFGHDNCSLWKTENNKINFIFFSFPHIIINNLLFISPNFTFRVSSNKFSALVLLFDHGFRRWYARC